MLFVFVDIDFAHQSLLSPVYICRFLMDKCGVLLFDAMSLVHDDACTHAQREVGVALDR